MSIGRGPAARIPLAAAVLAAALLLSGATAGAADKAGQGIDLVVLLDTSESTFPWFDDLMTYLVQDLLTARLHKGDTFHLLSFSSTPQEEVSLPITTDEASREAYRQVLLLHALDRYTDLVSALQYLYQYVKELPETNPKHLIIISDGVHDPPPGSPYAADASTVRGLVVASAGAMRREDWEVTLLRVPPQPAPADQGKKSYLDDVARALGVSVIPYPQDKDTLTGVATGYPSLVFPPALGPVGGLFTAGFRVRNWKDEPVIIALSSVQSEGAELLQRRVSVTVPARGEAPFPVPLRLPMSYPRGSHDAAVHLVFDGDPRISPVDGSVTFTYTGKGGFQVPRLTFLYVLYILLGVAAIFLIVRLFLYLSRKLAEAPLAGLARGGNLAAGSGHAASRTAPAAGSRAASPRRVVPARPSRPEARKAFAARAGMGRPMTRSVPRPPARNATRPAASLRPAGSLPPAASTRSSLPKPDSRAARPPLIEMRVQLQGRRAGFRNVHRMPPGAVKTVGGGSSSFLVFVVPVPARMAEIRNVDGRYVFTPLRPELFPGLKGPVNDCMGKEIPFVSGNGKEYLLYFQEWVAPLDEVNRVMGKARQRE